MSARIRLARHGRKKKPFYYIVVADSRAPRDGKFVERLGSYNPNTNPATIDLNFDRALYWLQTGALPTDTCKSLLSEKGVLIKNHLLKGVTKGALTTEQAEMKFKAWMEEKESKVKQSSAKYSLKQANEIKKKADAETKALQAYKEKLAKKMAAAVENKTTEENTTSEENATSEE